MTQTLLEAFRNDLEATFVAVGANPGDDVRGIALQQGMTVTPILESAADVHRQTIPAGNGQPARTFAYLDTEEGPRLSMTMLTRRGNGLHLQSGKLRDAFIEICERIIDHPGYQLLVSQTYSRLGANGTMQHQHVFTEVIPETEEAPEPEITLEPEPEPEPAPARPAARSNARTTRNTVRG